MKDKRTANDNTVTRARGVVEGLLLEVSPMAKKAGIPYPVFITKRVHENCIASKKASQQMQLLQDLMVTLHFTLAHAEPGQKRIEMIFVAEQSKSPSDLFHLEVVCAPLEKHIPIPAITIILPGEA